MKIIYYTWGENSDSDAINAFNELEHEVIVVNRVINDYHEDEEFREYFSNIVRGNCDCIFSFDYFPIISNIAEELQIPYISWVYDCPHTTLYSKSIVNSMNRIFVFDREQMNELKSLGCKNVYHQPLAAATKRLNAQLGKLDLSYSEYVHDVSFVGSLYENTMYDRIGYLPPYIRGYLDGIINAQQRVYGFNFPNTLLTSDIINEISKYVKFDFDDKFYSIDAHIIRELVNKKITSVERINLLNSVADNFSLALYSGSPKEYITNASYEGYVDYSTQMPKVFRWSKINLNITLRSITSGISLRVFDIMAAGGFLLSNYQPELEELFVNNEECVMYFSEDELLYYIHYYLGHEDERKQIAYNGYKKVNELYSYERIFKNVLSVV